MYFEQLQVESFRNLSEILLEPGPKLNVLVGKNASGKTAVLEAIYFLSRARSFRTARIREVIQHDKEVLHVNARLQSPGSAPVATGVEKGNGRSVVRYNGETIRTVSTQARQVPLVLITPDSHNLVTGTPKQRRHWLDWAMFHVEPNYLNWWRDYHKSLRQRNALLRSGGAVDFKEMSGWEEAMVETSENIQKARSRFVDQLQLALLAVLEDGFSGIPELFLQKGWPEDKLLSDLLVQNREKDRRTGHTRYGLHKADLRFCLQNRVLGAVCSRGQIKLFVNALLVAQAQVYEFYNREKPVFLVDDFSAELDFESQVQLLKLLDNQSAQVFLTATELRRENDINGSISIFHVEHGAVAEAVK